MLPQSQYNQNKIKNVFNMMKPADYLKKIQ